MLSRSDSWGWSIDGVHRWFRSRGAVLERSVSARPFGVTSVRAGDELVGSSWPGVCGAFDLTDAGGEVQCVGAGKGGDMETTLVRPLRGHGNRCVVECMVDNVRGVGRVAGGQQSGRLALGAVQTAGRVPRRLRGCLCRPGTAGAVRCRRRRAGNRAIERGGQRAACRVPTFRILGKVGLSPPWLRLLQALQARMTSTSATPDSQHGCSW